MKAIVGLIAACGMLTAGSANAGDWRQIIQTNDGYTALDFESVRNSRGHIFAWTASALYEHNETLNWDYTLTRQEVDCEAETIRVASYAYYTLDGASVYSSNTALEWGAVIPGSVADTIYKTLCQNQPTEGGSWSDAIDFAITVRNNAP